MLYGKVLAAIAAIAALATACPSAVADEAEFFRGKTITVMVPSSLGATLGLYGLLWLALAISPNDRADWALENVLVLAFVPALIASMRWFPLSRLSWTLILLFLSLHTVGAHYTYAEVPYDAWSEQLFGVRVNDLLGLERAVGPGVDLIVRARQS